LNEPTAITTLHELTAEEDLELRRALHRASRLRVPAIGFGAFCIGLGLVTGVQAGLDAGAGSAIATGLPWVLIGTFWMTFGLVPFSGWMQGSRVLGKHERSLDETGLHVRAGTVNIDLPWHAMSRTLETPAFFLFFDAQGRPQYLPKRGLRERELRDVQRLVAARGRLTMLAADERSRSTR
jgi:hypothetical protein